MVDQQPTWRRRAWRWGGAALGVLAFILIAAGLLTGQSAPTPATAVGGITQAGAAPATGHLAPDFALLDLTGTSVRLHDLRGHPVVINFWYTACPGCVQEMTLIQRAYQAHATAGLVVLGVDVVDTAPQARPFVTNLGVTYPILFDRNQGVMNEYQVNATPTSFFVDANGVIRAVLVGQLDAPTMRRDLAAIGAGT